MKQHFVFDGARGTIIRNTPVTNGHADLADDDAAAIERPLPDAIRNIPPGVSGTNLQLFVRAGKDGERLGGCPQCQRVYLVLATKAATAATGTQPPDAPPSTLPFTVTTVNVSRPPPEFARLSTGRRLPVLVDHDRDEVLSDVDEIIQYVDALFPVPQLGPTPPGAVAACQDVFSRFSFFVKDVSQSPAPLVAELRRLDAYLAASPRRFLSGDDRFGQLDCAMLPKLQHIRVVARAVKDFDIPAELAALWRYLADAYASHAFRMTCPSDQEIVYHWQCKPECHRLSRDKLAFYSTEATPRYSVDVPNGGRRQPSVRRS